MVSTRLIQTTEKIMSVKGRVFYNDRRRRIDIKRPIRNLFEDSRLKVGYTMELALSEEKAIERLKSLCKAKIMPVLLYFEVEEELNGI